MIDARPGCASSTGVVFVEPSWLDELDATPFLTRCRVGRATRRELHSFVRQQFYYSRHFTRYLCALMGSMAREDDRHRLASNLFEEMGLGDAGGTPHATIYRNMMKAMNVHAEEEPENPATRRLIEKMLRCCRDSNVLTGLSALGLGAEAIVPHVYRQIVNGFQAIGEPMDRLEFFVIHIDGDDEHAVTMRQIIERDVSRDPSQLGVVRDTAKAVIRARLAFFEEISLRADGLVIHEGDYDACVQFEGFSEYETGAGR